MFLTNRLQVALNKLTLRSNSINEEKKAIKGQLPHHLVQKGLKSINETKRKICRSTKNFQMFEKIIQSK